MCPAWSRRGARRRPALGRAGWADAATIVPWAVHESYADTEVLAAQLPSMRALAGATCRARRLARRAARRRVPVRRLARPGRAGQPPPPSPPGRPPRTYLANAFFARSARLVARAAAARSATSKQARTYAGGRPDDVAGRHLGPLAGARADHPDWLRGLAGARRCAGDAGRARSARRWRRWSVPPTGALATGFLGDAAGVAGAGPDFGYMDEGYLMLLRHEPPSWLYQVDQGGTTVWDLERDPGRRLDPPRDVTALADMPRPATAQMLSFNHYAYGAVVDWVYRHVAGLAPDRHAPATGTFYSRRSRAVASSGQTPRSRRATGAPLLAGAWTATPSSST